MAKIILPKSIAKDISLDQEPVKPVEPVVEEKPAETNDVVIDPLRELKRNQPILKSGRVFWPYFMAFLYNLVLLIALAALFMLPFISNAAYQGETALPSWLAVFGFDTYFPGLVSVFDIIYAKAPLIMDNPMNILVMIGDFWWIVLFVIPLVIIVIWFVIKFIHSFFAMLTCGFKHRKHKIIDNFYFKNTHQYFKIGILDFDFTFIIYLIFAVILWGGMNVKILLAQFEIHNDIIDGIALFRAFENNDLLNMGNIVFFCVVGALVLIRIIYRCSVIGFSRKVRKMYVSKYKRIKQ